jgi:hypothetical protein
MTIQEIQQKLLADGLKITVKSTEKKLNDLGFTPEFLDDEQYTLLKNSIIDAQQSKLARIKSSGLTNSPKATLDQTGYTANIQEIPAPQQEQDQRRSIAKHNAEVAVNGLLDIGEMTKEEIANLIQQKRPEIEKQSQDIMGMIAGVNAMFYGRSLT